MPSSKIDYYIISFILSIFQFRKRSDQTYLVSGLCFTRFTLRLDKKKEWRKCVNKEKFYNFKRFLIRNFLSKFFIFIFHWRNWFFQKILMNVINLFFHRKIILLRETPFFLFRVHPYIWCYESLTSANYRGLWGDIKNKRTVINSLEGGNFHLNLI